MVQHGTIVLKFWLHISQDEQLRRFREREQAPHKRHKLSAEDWRNRERWDDYKLAVEDMINRTSTSYAPWTLVSANSRYHARIQVLGTFLDALERELGDGGDANRNEN